ncbi:hypothetical protein D5086_021649 [Populus alba]|uniref:Uncharacterized protein n=1 Tax=Populus alba TaxID=43335 RepID=A0ACC4BDL5_POPAL
MHSDQYFHSKEAMPPLTNQVDNNNMHFPVATTFAAVQPLAAKHLMPVHGIEFQSSEICPRNFIIFDQADHRSQVMYNPAVAHNHGGPGFNIHATYIQENFERTDTYNVEREISSSLKEDSDDIDALMSLEEEEPEECDGEEVSTARTCGNYGSSSPDSCSSYGAKPMKKGSSVQKCSSSGSSSNSERKRQKMKTMVKTLRGIVPGGDQMNTVTVLDEAVRLGFRRRRVSAAREVFNLPQLFSIGALRGVSPNALLCHSRCFIRWEFRDINVMIMHAWCFSNLLQSHKALYGSLFDALNLFLSFVILLGGRDKEMRFQACMVAFFSAHMPSLSILSGATLSSCCRLLP